MPYLFHSVTTKIHGLKQICERIRVSACRMEPIRVGLVFDEKDGILSDAQKSEGLERCWFLLKPQLQGTVSDLIDHVLQAFQLRPSCPHGLILYMDGFVLPCFESISILKDRDVISVRKKGITYSLEGNNVSNLLLGNNASNLVRGLEGAQKGAAQTGALLLANVEFEKETGGYQSDEPEDEPKEEGEIQPDDLVDASKGGVLMHLSPQRNVTSKKRKAGQNLERSKDKKRRSEIHGCSENDPPEKQIEKTNKVKKHSARKEKKASKAKKKSSRKCTKVNDASVIAPETSESSDQAQQDEELEEASAKTEKRSSRSSRRKRIKRQWIREMYKIQSLSSDTKEEGIKNWKQSSDKAEAKKQNSWRQRPGKVDGKEDDGQPKGLFHWKQSSQWDSSRDANLNGNVYNKARQMDDSDGEVVPVVIKPGHIRFESMGKEKDVPEVCNEGPEVPQKWNGITSKRKGQKWGTEKGQKWGNEQGQKWGNEQGQKRGNEQGQKWGTERNSFSRRSNSKANRREEPKILVLPKDIHLDEPLDFEKYPVIDYLPKVGDVISYRIIELTSMWTPEPSSIRIGHVSWCSDKTANLVLTQIPGHPIELKKSEEQESEPLPFENPYKEDGSLETHFTGLLDVRIIKGSNEPSAEGATSQVHNGSVDTENTSNEKGEDASTLGTGLEDGETQTNGSVTGMENGEIQANGSANAEKSVVAWEILSEALNAKKDELSQGERTWEDVKTSAKGVWSNAAVRRGTLGPTIAYLRSKNQI